MVPYTALLLLAFCSSLQHTGARPDGPRECVGDAVAFGSQCLTFSSDSLKWDAAAAACDANGGRLATLEHPDEVVDYLKANYPRINFWTGASDAAIEGNWIWKDGQLLDDQFPWGSGEPNGRDIENCLQIRGDYGYFDVTCTRTSRYICEDGSTQVIKTTEVATTKLPGSTQVIKTTEVATTKLPGIPNKIAAPSIEFSIRQKISGKYLRPLNGTYLAIFEAWTEGSIFTFERQDAEWGYIRHKETKKLVTSNGGMVPTDDHTIGLSSDPRPWALFAIDQVNKHIISRSGLPMQLEGDERFYPSRGSLIYLQPWTNGTLEKVAAEFEIVTACGPCGHKEIPNIYGNATISGKWYLVYSVINPEADHTYEVDVAVGRSKSQSTTTTFKYAWEKSFSAKFWFSKMSVSAQLSWEIERSSSLTWTLESTTKATISVVPGKTVAVWQKDFIGEQYGHKQVHSSTMLADTDDPLKPPGENTPVRFI